MSNVSAIDAAIAAVQGKQMNKNKETGVTASDVRPATAKVRLTKEERAERDVEREQEKAERKATREAARAEKLRLKEEQKKPAHMTKVEKARARLTEMDEDTSLMLDELVSNMSLNQLDILNQHLALHVRAERTATAVDQTLSVGQAVRIVGGDPRFIGSVGTVIKAQRIRCYVSIPGYDRDIYLFISDVEALAEDEVEILDAEVETDETELVAATA